MGGFIAAGIYATNTPDACQYITNHSKAGVLLLEDNKQLAKYANLPAGSLPHLKAIVIWLEAADEKLKAKLSIPVYSFEAFLALGASVSDNALADSTASIKPGHCSTLIYTSGNDYIHVNIECLNSYALLYLLRCVTNVLLCMF